MPPRRSGARAVSRASSGIDDAVALLDSHPLSHSLHVVVPSLGSEGGGGVDGDDDARPPPSSSLLLPRPPAYFCVPSLDLADLTSPEFVEWAFPEGTGDGGACGLAAPSSLDAGAGAALCPDGRLVLSLPAEELARTGPASGPARRGVGGGSGWYTSEVFLTAGRGKRKRRNGEEKEKEAEEATREEGGATKTTTRERVPLAKARERLRASTGPVPFALLPPRRPRSTPPLPLAPPPLPGARTATPRERRTRRALAPHGQAPDFESFFRRVKGRERRREGTDVGGGRDDNDDEEREEEEEEQEEGRVDDRERLREALEWLGLSASLSRPSVSVVPSSPFADDEKRRREEASPLVDVSSFEGLLPSSFARDALEAAAAAVGGGGALPWAALVLVGFPDSPSSWTEGRSKGKAKATKAGEGASSPPPPPSPSSTAAAAVAARLGPEACREHALFVVVVKGKEGGPPRFLVAVASGGGDGFERL